MNNIINDKSTILYKNLYKKVKVEVIVVINETYASFALPAVH